MENSGIIFRDPQGSEVDIREIIHNRNVKAIFVDLGDTLVEMRREEKEKIIRKINNKCNLKIDLATFDRKIREEWKCRESKQELDRIKNTTKPYMEKAYWLEFYTCILEKLGARRRYPDLVKWLANVQSNPKSFGPMPGIEFFLSELAELQQTGIQTGIISNAFPSAREIVDKLFPVKFYPVILSYEYNSVKPESNIYRKAARMAKVRPGEILFVDDRLSFVQGASEFGMQAVLIEKNPTVISSDRGAGFDSAKQSEQEPGYVGPELFSPKYFLLRLGT